MKLWKVLGLAGLAGVAATGAIIVRDERRRAQMTPEQVRDRLHERAKDLPLQSTGKPGTIAPRRSLSARASLRAALRGRRARRGPLIRRDRFRCLR